VLLGTGGKQKGANGSTSMMCQRRHQALPLFKNKSANLFSGLRREVPNTLLNVYGSFLDYL
jgi:hypothetical protein